MIDRKALDRLERVGSPILQFSWAIGDLLNKQSRYTPSVQFEDHKKQRQHAKLYKDADEAYFDLKACVRQVDVLCHGGVNKHFFIVLREQVKILDKMCKAFVKSINALDKQVGGVKSYYEACFILCEMYNPYDAFMDTHRFLLLKVFPQRREDLVERYKDHRDWDSIHLDVSTTEFYKQG